MAEFKEAPAGAPMGQKLLTWVDNRFPASKLYKERGRREKNKARRVARDKARANLMDCGHGSRWRNRDNCAKCRREWRSV